MSPVSLNSFYSLSIYRIDNPLAHLSSERLALIAKAFAARVRPEQPDEELFIKAASIAQAPLNWETVRGLTVIETRALRHQRTLGFWSQTKTLRVTISILCVSAIIQGWNQTGGNGSAQQWPAEWDLTYPDDHELAGQLPQGRATWIFASVNAVTYLTASAFGCWSADPLQATRFGRRGAIFISGCICLASVIGAACTRSWQQLLAARAILGVGMGMKASVTPIYGAEVSPTHLRLVQSQLHSSQGSAEVRRLPWLILELEVLWS